MFPAAGVTKPLTDPIGRQPAVQLNEAPAGVEVKGTDQGSPEQILIDVEAFETAGTGRTSAVRGVLVKLLQLPVMLSASA